MLIISLNIASFQHNRNIFYPQLSINKTNKDIVCGFSLVAVWDFGNSRWSRIAKTEMDSAIVLGTFQVEWISFFSCVPVMAIYSYQYVKTNRVIAVRFHVSVPRTAVRTVTERLDHSHKDSPQWTWVMNRRLPPLRSHMSITLAPSHSRLEHYGPIISVYLRITLIHKSPRKSVKSSNDRSIHHSFG